MNLEQLIENLPADELATYQNLVEQAQQGADSKAVRGQLAKLTISVLKRLGEKPNPGPIIGQFSKQYFAAPKKPEVVPIEDLVRQFPYPLSFKLKNVLDDKARYQSGEDVPQYGYDCCAVMGLLVRIAAAIGIQSYVDLVGGSDIEFNRAIMETLQAPADGGWLSLARRLTQQLQSREGAVIVKQLHEGLGQRVQLEGEGKKKGGVQVSQALEQLVSFRNRLVHGERISSQELEEAVDLLIAAVRGFAFLVDYEMVVRQNGDGYRLNNLLPETMNQISAELPEMEPCLVSKKEGQLFLSLSPLLHFRPGAEGHEIDFDELFFLNAGSSDRLNYIAYRYARQMDGKQLDSYESFLEFMQKIPTPPIPKEPKIDFSSFVEYHTRLFVGRVEILQEIEQFVQDRPTAYGILKALAGMGKTAIIAKLHQMMAAESVPSGHRWVFHFCMHTDGRDNPVVALRSLTAHICDLFGRNRKNWLSNDVEELKDQKFPALLNDIRSELAEGERLVLVIDALDEGISGDQESVPSVLPQYLPDHVVGVVSYRVDNDNENTRVEEQISHILEERRQVFSQANPLKGLTHHNVAEFLQKASEREEIPSATLEAVWQAAIQDTQDMADPFYLRFVAEGLDTKRILVERAETVPTSLDEAFNQLWINLPADRDFLVYRLLCNLAVMYDYVDDAFFAELFNRQVAEGEELMRPDDIAVLRAQVGKLLVYDGDKYNLFHDRFRTFLVGARVDAVAQALGEI